MALETLKGVEKMNRFDYVKYDAISQAKSTVFKKEFMELEGRVMEALPGGRAKSLVLTKLEEAYMWVGKAIRDEQLDRNGEVELQEERNNA